MTQTLTTEELRQIVETDHVQCGDAAAMAHELLANREAQPVFYVEKATVPTETVQTIVDAPAVNAALCSFYEDATNDNAFFLVRAIMEACRAAMLAQPVSQGYKLVPVEPTDEMIAAAMNCDDVEFNSDETFCVNFDNIYRAMLAAAPEGGN